MAAELPLSDDERRVLEALMRQDAMVHDKTLEQLASATGLETSDTQRVLGELHQRSPPLALPMIDEWLGERFWISTPYAPEAIEASDGPTHERGESPNFSADSLSSRGPPSSG
jgi:hypothetical protein